MNFGQNLYNWFLSNAQSLVLMAIVVIGIYLGFKREFSKLIGFLVVALVAVGLVFNACMTVSVSLSHSPVRERFMRCRLQPKVQSEAYRNSQRSWSLESSVR